MQFLRYGENMKANYKNWFPLWMVLAIGGGFLVALMGSFCKWIHPHCFNLCIWNIVSCSAYCGDLGFLCLSSILL